MESLRKSVTCPECLGEMEVPEDVMVGDLIECPDCGAEFEVYDLDGDNVKLRLVEGVGEDWGE